MINSRICHVFIFSLVIFHELDLINGGAVVLDDSNFDSIVGDNELVFINFYADWCRFSHMLAPVWDETADKVREAFPEDQKKVVVGKIDCEAQKSISSRFHISKYPTLKLLRNGQVSKREYRGQRSADSFADFIKEQLTDPIATFGDLNELKTLQEKKRSIIGYFESGEIPVYQVFRKVASLLKDDCQFLVGFGTSVNAMHPPGESIVTFKSQLAHREDAFIGDLTDYDELSKWATERCIPLVREITFQNAEELTEEGLPFLILFHDSEDKESMKRYTEIVLKDLSDQKSTINFLTADGIQFAHPLHHLGKSKKDLPLIAIDSFRHMYLFPSYKDIDKPGMLKQFIADLHSGKLHREFHYGPDPDTTEETAEIEDNGSDDQPVKKPTSPPESTFKKLAPSKNRYTLIDKDEL